MTPSIKTLIFGAGRVGASMAAYWRDLGHEVAIASRTDSRAAILKAGGGATLVAAAIPDDGLAGWAADWREAFPGSARIHFSGAQIVPGVFGYHPLYSFPRHALPPQTVGAIAIAREASAPPFAEILPGARNPEFVADAQDRAFYHALAVLSGNFAAHLWNETATAFAGRFGADAEPIFGPYLESVVARFRESPQSSMTGPAARRDRSSVAANLKALEGDPRLSALYRAFLDSAWPDWRAEVLPTSLRRDEKARQKP